MDESDEVIALPKQPKPPAKWPVQNTMSFPHALRDAIPTMPTCWGRSLVLSSIDGDCGHSWLGQPRVKLKLVVEESGKLTGSFDVHADLDVEAARAFARTLAELVARAESMPPES